MSSAKWWPFHYGLNVLQKDRIQTGHDTAYCSQDHLGAGNVWEKNAMVVKEFFWDAYCFPLLSTTPLDLVVDTIGSNLRIFSKHQSHRWNGNFILMKFSSLASLPACDASLWWNFHQNNNIFVSVMDLNLWEKYRALAGNIWLYNLNRYLSLMWKDLSCLCHLHVDKWLVLIRVSWTELVNVLQLCLLVLNL